MSWSEIKKAVHSDLSKPLNELIDEKSVGQASMVSNLKILTNTYKKWVKSIFFLYVWFVLLVNGMFIYQHYLYSIIIFFTILTCNPIFKREEDVHA